MSSTEPGKLEAIVTRFATATFGRGYYRKLASEVVLTGNETVMDFGSGAGMAAKYLAKDLSKGDGRLTCVDISKAWIEMAKKRTRLFSNVDYKIGHISTLEVGDKSYDVVLVSYVLHDVETQERPTIVSELASRLKPGGRIVIREPTKKNHGMDPNDIRSLMSGAGLREVESVFLKGRFDATYLR